MLERDFTARILVPLFKALGYTTVDFHGGPDEQGKDLICWRVDELDEVELAVVQVKRYKPSRRARDGQSFSEIVTQLSQCIETAVPNANGHVYQPTTVYLVTPYAIDTRTLSSRFEK